MKEEIKRGRNKKMGEIRVFLLYLWGYSLAFFPLVTSAFALFSRKNTTTAIDSAIIFVFIAMLLATDKYYDYYTRKTGYKELTPKTLKKATEAVKRNSMIIMSVVMVSFFISYALSFIILFQQNLVSSWGIIVLAYGIGEIIAFIPHGKIWQKF